MSQSQLGQDEWVLSLFGKDVGCYVDVGFHDGIFLSNTYLLEKKGWFGLGIDPFPQNFISRPRTIIYENIVYDVPGVVVDVCINGVFSGILSDIDRHKNQTINKPLIQLTTKTLESILDEAKFPSFIEYLSLDTEGSEYKILSSFDFNKYSFGCITVEHNMEVQKRKLIRDKLENNGYELHKEV